jgi:hypothetical protein
MMITDEMATLITRVADRNIELFRTPHSTFRIQRRLS